MPVPPLGGWPPSVRGPSFEAKTRYRHLDAIGNLILAEARYDEAAAREYGILK